MAEDAIQEAFLSAFQSLVFYRGEASFGSWLKRIVINKAISLNRKELKYEFREDDHSMDSIEHYKEKEDASNYDIIRVREAIAELPDGFRTVLSLCLVEGSDHQEISQILGIVESTSKTQYKRAKEKLKRMLSA